MASTMFNLMRFVLYTALCVGLLSDTVIASSITFQVSDPPGGGETYTYFISGITLQANQDLELDFPPSLFASLWNGVAGNGFELLLLQPNNPPGTSGIYDVLALANNTDFTGSFSVDSAYTGPGQPGSQPYSINQFDAGGKFISEITSGMTEPANQVTSPEPASFPVIVIGLLVMGLALRSKRRSSGVD